MTVQASLIYPDAPERAAGRLLILREMPGRVDGFSAKCAAARFGAFTLDPATRRLLRGTLDVHLTPKAFDLLSLLVIEAPRVADVATISRRDRILVGEDGAVLEDLGSRNRTKVGDAAVRAAMRLQDGDRIRVGPKLLVYRASPTGTTTDTQAF